jgi:hypothetical protein
MHTTKIKNKKGKNCAQLISKPVGTTTTKGHIQTAKKVFHE